MNSIAVVVLNWNGIKDTLGCFESLRKQTARNFKIVIIDNGSTDDSVNVLRELEPKHKDILTVLYNPINKGFTGGVNIGIEWALEKGFDGIALFNNDAIADPHWLENLSNDFPKKTGAVTGLLLNKEGTKIDSTGEQYSVWGLGFPRDRNQMTSKAPVRQPVFGATGGATLYRSDVFREIGLFDDTFFAYYEDVDVSFRMQLAGWNIYYEPSAVAHHQQGATAARMPGHFTVYQTFKNLPLLFTKNVPKELLLPIGVRLWFAYILMLGNAIKDRRGGAALKGWLMSIILFWSSALPKRLKIQAHKKVSTEYIRSILWADLPPDQSGIRKVRKFFTGK
jgi:GT2 family glycosyltransferase